MVSVAPRLRAISRRIGEWSMAMMSFAPDAAATSTAASPTGPAPGTLHHNRVIQADRAAALIAAQHGRQGAAECSQCFRLGVIGQTIESHAVGQAGIVGITAPVGLLRMLKKG
jgi:hypothetical protein